MAIANALTHQFDNGQSIEVLGTFTASGNYAAGGTAVAWTGLGIKSTQAPLFVQVVGKAGYVYEYDDANAKLLTRESVAAGNPLAEIPTAAYPAGVTGDTIKYRAVFKKNV